MVLFGLTVIVVSSTELEHRGQPADPVVPRAGRAVLGGRRRLRRPDRPAPDPGRDQRPARRGVRRRCTSPATNLAVILLLNIVVSTVTVFFAPAEAAMIPVLVPRAAAPRRERDLHADPQRGLRARASPCSGRSSSTSPAREAVILVVAALYFLGRGLLLHAAGVAPAGTDRGSPHRARASGEAERRDGLDARPAPRGLQLHPRQPGDRLVAALPRHRRVARRRARRPRARLRAGDARPQAEGLRGRRPAARVRDRDRASCCSTPTAATSTAGGSSRAASSPSASCWRRSPRPARSAACSSAPTQPGGLDLSAVTSLLAVVVVIAFFAGIAYGLVAIPAQTAAPGGPARGRPRARVRRPEHARLGRELPADHHRRPDLRPRRHDRGHPRRRRSRSSSSGSCRS